MDRALVFSLILIGFLVLVLARIKIHRAVSHTAETRANPEDPQGKVYQFGTSRLTTDIPFLSIALMTASSIALSMAVLFVLLGFEERETFWFRVLKLSLGFLLLLGAWYRVRLNATQKTAGKEIVTSSEAVAFSLNLQMRLWPWLFMVLKGQSYLILRWDNVSDWRVLRTQYGSDATIWVREYRIRIDSKIHILARSPLAGLEEIFLSEVRSYIGNKLTIEDQLVDTN